MADDETLARFRPATGARTSPSQLLRDLAKVGPAEPDPASAGADGELDCLPLPGEAYVAHSRLGTKPEAMLSLLLADWSIRTFAFGDLRHMDYEPGTGNGNGPGLILRFIGVAEVRLQGRHLHRLVDPLRRHRISWLAERPGPRDYLDEDDVVITGIIVTLAE